MPDSGAHVQELHVLALNELCRSMDKRLLEYVLQCVSPSMCLDIIWKLLDISDETQTFVYSNSKNTNASSVIRGHELAKMSSLNTSGLSNESYKILSDVTHTEFAKTQQIEFVDRYNFCDHFNLDLFFKLLEIPGSRNKLFTIFQVCIQIKGFTFPKQLAEQWVNNEKQQLNNDVKSHFHNIEQGLKLGIFLGDAGWLNESAIVLSHTHDIITIKWVCSDQNLGLLKKIQCLTKWLFVVSNSYNFNKGKRILHLMLDVISISEQIDNKELCISYAYVAVSQYYYVLMKYNEAWAWAVKAVRQLCDTSCDVLKLLVISHAVRISSVLNKLSTGKKLIDQLHSYDREIDQNIHVDMLLNEASYSLKADLAKDSINSYYAALDSRRNLFGYFNLHTATVFVDYAYARYVCDYPTTNFNEAMSSILQGIFIMNKIGLPEDNMFLISAGRIKALILEEKALDLVERSYFLGQHYTVGDSERMKRMLKKMKKHMLNEARILQENALRVSLNAVGEKALVTAKSYCNLGRLYQSQEKYKQSEKMHLKAIEIKEAILGKDDPEVALSLGHLASLYTYQLKRYNEAEQLYLRSKAIYENTYGDQYTGLLYDFQGLVKVYNELKDPEAENKYLDKVMNFHQTRQAWLYQVHTAHDENCTKDNLSLDKLKCIIDECGCEKL